MLSFVSMEQLSTLKILSNYKIHLWCRKNVKQVLLITTKTSIIYTNYNKIPSYNNNQKNSRQPKKDNLTQLTAQFPIYNMAGIF